MNAMNPTWRKWSDRYAAMSQREQLLIAAATIVSVGLLLLTFWVDPAAKRVAGLQASMSTQQTEFAALQGQIASIKSQLSDPDAANRKALDELRARLTGVDDQIGRLDEKLVPPQQMGKLLQRVLTHHRGLTLVSLRSMPPEPLLASPSDKGVAGKESVMLRENIFRHGLEIKVAGSYADLLAYVAELESAPQRLLWGGVSLAVIAYPRSELTLTVYTLSRERDWLAV
jgi:MSHA biogenesis protein MshJ